MSITIIDNQIDNIIDLDITRKIERPSVGGGSVVPFSPTDLPNLWHWFSSDFGTFYDAVGLDPAEPNVGNQNLVQYWENKAEIPDNEAAVKLKVGSADPLILYRNQNFREDLENTFGAVSDIIYQSVSFGGTGKVCFKPLTDGVWFIANFDTTGGVGFNTVIQSTGGDTTYPWQGTTWPSPPVLTVSKLNAYPAQQSTEDLRPTLEEQTINGTTYRKLFFQNDWLSVNNNIALNSSLSIYVVGNFSTATSFGCIFGGTRKQTPPQGVRNGLCVTSGGKLALVKSSFVTSTLDNNPQVTGIIFGVINSNGTGTIGKQSESISVSEDLTGLGTVTETNTNSYIMGVISSVNVTNGNIYELLVYRDVHTVEQQNQVISYLNERYPFIN